MSKSSVAPCPCGGTDYANCCKPYHDGTEPPSADRLMRARYSAYVLGLMPYVHATWHASTRPPLSELTHDASIKWLGLEIKKHVPQQDEATVEFVARSKSAGRAHRLHEIVALCAKTVGGFISTACSPNNRLLRRLCAQSQ